MSNYGFIRITKGNPNTDFYLSLRYYDGTTGACLAAKEQGYLYYTLREAIRCIKADAGVMGKHGIEIIDARYTTK